MRKIISIFFIVFGLALLVISSSDRMMKIIIDKRTELNNSFGFHQSLRGDLVSISYLDKVKKFQDHGEYKFVRPAYDTTKKNIDLYIYGDSYLKEVPDSAYAYVNNYHFCRRGYQDMEYTLDAHKRNILIIEIAERFARVEFELQETMRHFKKKQPATSLLKPTEHPMMNAGLMDLDIFNPDINRNLEINLYGYRFWDEVKFAKASLTYYLFKRAAGDAIVSDDGERLFLKETTTETGRASSYYSFDDREMQQMYFQLNATCAYYRKDGFDEVYLSIIPNPVTILQPSNYNEVIPHLQKADSLKCFRILDLYSIYTKDPDPGRLFRLDDTHWTNYGLQLWLQTVNAALKKESQMAEDRSVSP